MSTVTRSGADRPGDPDALGRRLVAEHTIWSTVVGSRAFGLATEQSDLDRRGVFLAPTPLFWSLRKPPTHVDGPDPEQFSWEVERFCQLALRANPNALEVLYSPLVETSTPLGGELSALRGAFLSRLAHRTYTGYADRQLDRVRADLRARGAPRWKHVLHLLRLLMCCDVLLRTGRLELDVGPHRDRLLAVRRGEVGWPEVERWRSSLVERTERALAASPLPEAPDTEAVDAWLVSVRRRSALDLA